MSFCIPLFFRMPTELKEATPEAQVARLIRYWNLYGFGFLAELSSSPYPRKPLASLLRTPQRMVSTFPGARDSGDPDPPRISRLEKKAPPG